MAHRFIILGDDIYTLDNVAERELAAAHMRDAGIERCSVFRGGPDGNESPEGRDFGSDGQFHYDGAGGVMAQRKTRETVEQYRARREREHAEAMAKLDRIQQSSLERDYRVTALMGW